ncbi:50S ribosomal protein L1 [Caldithrix abyssi]|uniref:Large ribosomal subunit protein uL1 n=1 Tax=Caldithrix abyssi DSM 13497 TaxID=880073 RepID=H1XVG8_CALAY|nr:50S ribosomal protein L1 [Caldithrix abyssi]APF17643.1 rplA LSU ribosomal protein L1P [Caldithrix abyssi DSM 13497]EHO41726.1 ribosomal protein L1 [Caldithrix abyssi DSM 13497]
MKRSKRYRELIAKIDKDKEYSLEEAVKLLKEIATAKFDETVEIAMRLGVDPRHADQMVRGTVVLPHGTGKKVRVLVFAKGEKVQEALDAGADYAGLDEYIEQINKGWLDFDVAVATPDVMSKVGRLGRILGARGLMPNPKSGTVTMDVAKAVKEIKAGKIDFRVDKTGIVHSGVAKVSFDEDKIIDNIKTFVNAVIRLKPASAKGAYLRSIAISSTMSPGIFIDRNASTYSM